MTRMLDRRMLVFTLAVVALVLAMTTAAYAVGANSVNSRAIINGQVKTVDLAKNSVNSAKLADGKVKGIDLADGSVGSKDLADGSVGTTDIADGGVGPEDISESAVGSSQLGQILTVTQTSVATTDADGSTNGGDVGLVATGATCPSGSRVLSGGAEWVDPSSGSVLKNLYIHTSRRSGNGWFVRGVVDFGAQGNVKLRVSAECLLPGGIQN
jgi:hypothetical protein